MQQCPHENELLRQPTENDLDVSTTPSECTSSSVLTTGEARVLARQLEALADTMDLNP